MVFSTQLCEMLPFFTRFNPPPPPFPLPVWISILCALIQCMGGGGGSILFWASDRKISAVKFIYMSFFSITTFCIAIYESYFLCVYVTTVHSERTRADEVMQKYGVKRTQIFKLLIFWSLFLSHLMFGAFWLSSCRVDPCTSLAYNKWRGQDNSTIEDTTTENGCAFDNSTKKAEQNLNRPFI